MIKVGDQLTGNLAEYVETATEACAVGPNPVDVAKSCAGKKIIIFGLPGAFTPTCSNQHVPGYVKHADKLRSAGIDEVWCVSVNDAFVMGAWGRDLKVGKHVRMIGDGNGSFCKSLGLTQDLSRYGMGTRAERFAMLVDNGIVKKIDVEQGGKFEVSSAEAMLKHVESTA